jgi:hypothetical protein
MIHITIIVFQIAKSKDVNYVRLEIINNAQFVMLDGHLILIKKLVFNVNKELLLVLSIKKLLMVFK